MYAKRPALIVPLDKQEVSYQHRHCKLSLKTSKVFVVVHICLIQQIILVKIFNIDEEKH